MDIKCPHCDTQNIIEFAENICCNKCRQSFAGSSFRECKPKAIGTLTAIILGGFGTQWVDKHFFEANRYSVGAIYEIVNHCANPEDAYMTEWQRRQLAQKCICALDNSLGAFPESELKKRSSEFLEIFKNNLKTCK